MRRRRTVGRLLDRDLRGNGTQALGEPHAGEAFVVDDEDAFERTDRDWGGLGE